MVWPTRCCSGSAEAAVAAAARAVGRRFVRRSTCVGYAVPMGQESPIPSCVEREVEMRSDLLVNPTVVAPIA